MKIPFGVMRCLYIGINEQLERQMRLLDHPPVTDISVELAEGTLSEIRESVSWYKENCLVSAYALDEKLNELEPKYEAWMKRYKPE